MLEPQSLSIVVHRQRLFIYSMALFMSAILLASCSGLGSGSGNSGNSGNSSSSQATTTSTAISNPVPVALTHLHWCGKPVTIFRDEGAINATPTAGSTPIAAGSTPSTITNWAEVSPNLGFTVFLPLTMLQGTCLISTIGTLHDPILGGSFIITYLLANHSSISISEAPLRTQNLTFQCNPTPTGNTAGAVRAGTPTPSPGPAHAPTQLCTGAHDKTNIVFSAQGDTATLQQFFNTLQPNVNWIPSS